MGATHLLDGTSDSGPILWQYRGWNYPLYHYFEDPPFADLSDADTIDPKDAGNPASIKSSSSTISWT